MTYNTNYTTNDDPYMSYLANKTFMLPALSEQKQTIISEKGYSGHSRMHSKTTVGNVGSNKIHPFI